MTDVISLTGSTGGQQPRNPAAQVEDAPDPSRRFFDKTGQQVPVTRWEALRGEGAYQQLRITNIAGFSAAGGLVYIRVHTVWTGIGAECGPPCCGQLIFETRVFDYFDHLPGLRGQRLDLSIPWGWHDAAEAVEGHDAIVSDILACVPGGRARLDEALTPTLDLREIHAYAYAERRN
jgi:hypothetical protein